jgi:peptidoglycan/LPS O-acetylase OafA/YrhL
LFVSSLISDYADLSRAVDKNQMDEGRDKIIDGWRGLSVLLVVIGHAVSYRFAELWDVRPLHEDLWRPLSLLENITIRIAADCGDSGVQVFFMISGFLITKLLIAEQARTGTVSIGAFYVRRIFRIIPAFYFYLITIFLLYVGGAILMKDEAFIRSGLFICNLSGFKCSWWLAHTWSLSVEEQFYLVWPLAFVFLGKNRVPAVICVSVILIISSYFLLDLTSFAHISVGALIAISDRGRNLIGRLSPTPVILVAGAILAAKPLAFPLPHVARVIQVFSPLLTALVFFGTLHKCGGPLLRVVSSRSLQKIGIFSYSIYLWQQLSLAPYTWGGADTGAGGLYERHPLLVSLVFVPFALLSYSLVERPLIKVGHNISRRIIGGRIDSMAQSPNESVKYRTKH